MIEAFSRAFGRPEPNGPLLVLKAHHLGMFPELQEALRLAMARVGGILLEESYTREQMNSLLNCVDAYVSLHRSEGFGLGMAESMYLGKPVIGTYYSANTDFMTPENSYCVGYRLRPIVAQDHHFFPECARVYELGQLWAEPDIRQAALWMKYLYEHPDKGAQRGQLAVADIRSYCSPDVVAELIKGRLRQILKASNNTQ